MPDRKGGRGKCATCAHINHEQINADLLSKVSMVQISTKYGISESSLKAHKRNHLSIALKAVQAERELRNSANSAINRLEAMIATCENLLKAAQGYQDDKGNLLTIPNVGQALAAVRELRATIELLARITGELDERPTTVINVLTTEAWSQTRRAIFEELAPYPDIRIAVSNRLMLLEGKARELPQPQSLDAGGTRGGV